MQAVGEHAGVYRGFLAMNQYVPGITQDAANAHARLRILITTPSGTQEQITPEQITDGLGDGWLTAMNQAITASGRDTYVRLIAEMDGYWSLCDEQVSLALYGTDLLQRRHRHRREQAVAAGRCGERRPRREGLPGDAASQRSVLAVPRPASREARRAEGGAGAT